MGCEPTSTTESTNPPSDESEATKQSATLEVEVFYRERMLLPPTATLEVVLEDSAKMDVAAELIARIEQPVEGGPPYELSIEYDPKKLDERGRYGVRARIENDGALMFTSTQFNPAFGKSGSIDETPNAPVIVMLTRTGSKPAASSPSLTGTRWVVETLRGEPVGPGAGGRAPDLTFEGSEPRAHGFAGCNQFTGGYTVAGDRLSFGQMAMTMRACTEGMDVEQSYAKALAQTKSQRRDGNRLFLMDDEGSTLVTLRAE
jgi:putative lipoprotein